MRLFFALCPQPDVRHALASTQLTLAAHLPKSVRPTATSDLHLTLFFLGEVTNEQRILIEQLASTLVFPFVSLDLAVIKFWRRADIICLAPTCPPSTLIGWVDQLRNKLCAFSPLSNEKTPYLPHVTLFRHAKFSYPFEKIHTETIRWSTNQFSLLESKSATTNAPQNYHVLRTWSANSRAKT